MEAKTLSEATEEITRLRAELAAHAVELASARAATSSSRLSLSSCATPHATAVPPTPLSAQMRGLSPSNGANTPSWLREAAGAETPSWLREAGGHETRQHETRQHESEQQQQQQQQAAEEERQARMAELAAVRRELTEERALHESAARGKAQLAQECEELTKERDLLAREKGELLAEVAHHAGHLNHKQKIHYVSQLKSENDALKQELKELRAGKRGGAVANKENQSHARVPRAGHLAPPGRARPRTALPS
jgi:DNA repair exonuclease SbcCD ATPase subunit